MPRRVGGYYKIDGVLRKWTAEDEKKYRKEVNKKLKNSDYIKTVKEKAVIAKKEKEKEKRKDKKVKLKEKEKFREEHQEQLHIVQVLRRFQETGFDVIQTSKDTTLSIPDIVRMHNLYGDSVYTELERVNGRTASVDLTKIVAVEKKISETNVEDLVGEAKKATLVRMVEITKKEKDLAKLSDALKTIFTIEKDKAPSNYSGSGEYMKILIERYKGNADD